MFIYITLFGVPEGSALGITTERRGKENSTDSPDLFVYKWACMCVYT